MVASNADLATRVFVLLKNAGDKDVKVTATISGGTATGDSTLEAHGVRLVGITQGAVTVQLVKPDDGPTVVTVQYWLQDCCCEPKYQPAPPPHRQ